jgi:hypothetical protein
MIPSSCSGVRLFLPPLVTQQPEHARLQASVTDIIIKAGKKGLPLFTLLSKAAIFERLRNPKFRTNFHSNRGVVPLTTRYEAFTMDV